MTARVRWAKDTAPVAMVAWPFRKGTRTLRTPAAPTLIVLDDAADETQVGPLLADRPGCLTLITSRRRLTDLESAYHISLDVLPPTEAIDLFARVAGPERAAVEPEPVAAVVRLCGYLPLAIRVAAARLRSRPTWTVAHLAERLSEGQRRLGELVTGDLSVAAAFTMSYERPSSPTRAESGSVMTRDLNCRRRLGCRRRSGHRRRARCKPAIRR